MINYNKERKEAENYIKNFTSRSDEEKIQAYEHGLIIFPKHLHDYLTAYLIKHLNSFNLKKEYAKKLTKESFCVFVLTFFKKDEEKIEIFKSFNIDVSLSYLYNAIFEKTNIIPFLKNNRIYQGENKKVDIPNFEENFILPSLTFGVELEAENGNASLIRNLQLPLYDNWQVKPDDSLQSNSIEITSPPLHYTKEDLNKLTNICNFMNANGLEATSSCAGHIHIGANILDTKEAWICFYYLYSTTENILAVLANEKGTSPRNKVDYYSKSIYKNFLEAINNGLFNTPSDIELTNFITLLKYYFQPDNDRHYSVNILHIGKNINKETIEFRIPNGTINPESIHQNIKLFARLILLSKTLSRDYEKGLNFIDKLTQMPIEERTIKLINTLFNSDYDKSYFYDRWITNYTLINQKTNEEKAL